MSSSSPDIARQVAAGLLEIGAIRLSPAEPFTWASGWKSPIYCDNRLALSYPALRSRIREGLCDLIKIHYPGVDAIAGVATAGIPQGALVADALQLPFAYVRSKPKEHGLSNQIEGRITPGQRVVVVEDLISTGSSSIAAGLALRQCGASVLGMVAIFTYEFELARQNFAQNGLSLHCLSSYSALLAEAAESGAITQSEADLLARWRESPSTWGNS